MDRGVTMGYPLSLAQIYPDITAGQPQTFVDAQAAFKTVEDKITAVNAGLVKAMGNVVNAGAWKGPGATAFGDAANKLLTGYVATTAHVLNDYPPEMGNDNQQLTTARANIIKLNTAFSQTTNPDVASFNAAAQRVINQLADAYTQSIGNLAEIPAPDKWTGGKPDPKSDDKGDD